MQRKSVWVVAILFIALIIAALLVWNTTKQNKKPPVSKKTTNTTTTITSFSDPSSPTADSIVALSIDSAKKYSKLMSLGQTNAGVNNNKVACPFFEKAVTITGISQEEKNAAYIGLYKCSEKLGDKAKMQIARTGMGEDVYVKITQLSQVNQ